MRSPLSNDPGGFWHQLGGIAERSDPPRAWAVTNPLLEGLYGQFLIVPPFI
jgi:hypothetical protein